MCIHAIHRRNHINNRRGLTGIQTVQKVPKTRMFQKRIARFIYLLQSGILHGNTWELSTGRT